jgi:hypothetical protein
MATSRNQCIPTRRVAFRAAGCAERPGSGDAQVHVHASDMYGRAGGCAVRRTRVGRLAITRCGTRR